MGDCVSQIAVQMLAPFGQRLPKIEANRSRLAAKCGNMHKAVAEAKELL